MKWLKFSIFSLVVLGLFTAAYPAKYTIRFLGTSGPNSTIMQGAQEFGRIINKETHGNVDVQICYNDRCGNGKKYTQITLVKGVMDGEIEMSMDSSVLLENYEPKIGVFDLPFLFRDYNHYYKVLDGPIGQELLKGLPDKILGLAYFDITPRGIATVNKEIRSPEDLKGLRIRTMEGPVFEATYKQWGAEPVPIFMQKVAESARKGYIQGEDQSYVPFQSFHHYQEFKFYTQTFHAMGPEPIFINKAYYESLPKVYQEIVSKAAIQAARWERAEAMKKVAEIKKRLKGEGTTVVKLTSAEREVFEKSSEPVYSQFAYQFGDLVQRIKDVH